MSQHNTRNRPVTLSFPATPGRRRAPRRWICQLGAFPPVRMPADRGGYLVTGLDLDPAGGCAGFSAVWQRFLDPANTEDGALVLQLHTPETEDPDEPVAEQRVAVSLWLARTATWRRVRSWPSTGAGWPQQVAPWIHAALLPASGRTTGPRADNARDGVRAGGH